MKNIRKYLPRRRHWPLMMFFLFLVYFFHETLIPKEIRWTLFTPRLSCSEALSGRHNSSVTAKYAEFVGYDFVKIKKFLENSDFEEFGRDIVRPRRDSPQKVLSIHFKKIRHLKNNQCLLQDLYDFDGAIVNIHVEIDDNTKVISIT